MSEYMELRYDAILHETDEAVRFDFGDNYGWVPKSVIEEDPIDLDINGGTVKIKSWFVIQNELEDYLDE